MRNPSVSVVMSVYRDRGSLVATIESVLTQSFRDFEFIIIDDASPDAALATLRSIADRDERVRIVTNEVNLGLTRSLNRGLDVARGTFIARIDEGDLWDPGKLEAQVSFLRANPEFVMVGSRYRNYLPGALRVPPATCLPLTDGEIRHWLFCGLTPITHPAIVFRKGLVKYNEAAKTSQDFDLCLRLSLLGRICNLGEELVSVLRPADCISARKRETQFFEHLAMHAEFLNVLRGRSSEQTFVTEGTRLPGTLWALEMRSRYMRFCLERLDGLKSSRLRKLLSNVLVPDLLVYFLRKRSAPWLEPKTYRSWVARQRNRMRAHCEEGR